MHDIGASIKYKVMFSYSDAEAMENAWKALQNMKYYESLIENYFTLYFHSRMIGLGQAKWFSKLQP